MKPRSAGHLHVSFHKEPPVRKLPLLLASVAGAISFGQAGPATADTGGTFSQEQICKATIAKIMGRAPKSMKVSKNEGGVVYLYYIRQNDKSKWTYRCKLEGNQSVVWATETGRWRTDPREEQFSYRISGGSLEIVEKNPDGSSSKETFKTSQLGR